MRAQVQVPDEEARVAFTSYVEEAQALQEEIGKLGEPGQLLTNQQLGHKLAELHAHGLHLANKVLSPGSHALRLKQALCSQDAEDLLCRFNERLGEINRRAQDVGVGLRSTETRLRNSSGLLQSPSNSQRRSADLRGLSSEARQCILKIIDTACQVLEAIEARPLAVANDPGASKSMATSRHYLPADIVILTVLPEEFSAVLSCLTNASMIAGSEDNPNTYSWHSGTLSSSLYGEPFQIVVGKGTPTTNYGALAAQRAIDLFAPRYVVFVGVGGGLQSDKGQKHGDVVVSSTVCSYEYGKIDSTLGDHAARSRSGFVPRNDFTYPADAGLVRAAEAAIARGDKWWRDQENSSRIPNAQTGQIGSGDKVIDNPTEAFFSDVLRQWPKLLAVEMEGAGVGAAIHDAHAQGRRVGFLLVRGLSDLPHAKLAGEAASTAERDNWKPLASLNAATFLACLIDKLWPVPPRNAATDPSHDSDIGRLRGIVAASLSQVANSIGAQIRIPRLDEICSLESKLAKARGVAIVGPSGTGKSALLRDLVEARLNDRTETLWFDVSSFEDVDYLRLEASLGLEQTLRRFAECTRSPLPLLVLDGFDRVLDAKPFHVAFALASNFVSTDMRWKIALTCQTDQWNRVRVELIRAGFLLDGWQIHQCEPLASEDLTSIWNKIPGGDRLRLQKRIIPTITNLKILDLIVAKLLSGGDIPASGWIGESSIALWYWDSYINTGSDAPIRTRIVSTLAQCEPTATRAAMKESSFQAADLATSKHQLTLDHVIKYSLDGWISFDHDLIGDWVRFHAVLADSVEIIARMTDWLNAPLWPRAIRLYGLYLLEHCNDANRWHDTIIQVSTAHGSSAGDLLLESLIYSANSAQLLSAVRDILMSNEGDLLRRLMNRFLLFATLPDLAMLPIARRAGMEDDQAELAFRRPSLLYWPPVLEFLYSNRHQCVSLAPIELSKIVELWLRHGRHRTLRAHLATIALALGDLALELSTSYRERDKEIQKHCFGAALLAATDLPEETRLFALRAAHRLPVTQELDEPDDTLSPPYGISDDYEVTAISQDAPYGRVAEEFRNAVLNIHSFAFVIDALPSVAREVSLAVLLSKTEAHRSFDPLDHEYGIEDPGWKVLSFTQGPFLYLLRRDFKEGLELVARLTEFATLGWLEHFEQYEHRRSWYASRTLDQPASDIVPQRKPEILEVIRDGTCQSYIGGPAVYSWPMGGGSVPDVVMVALMALEKHLYMRVEQGDIGDVGDVITDILVRARSVAFVKILADVGKMRPELFDGPLRPLLGQILLFIWDFQIERQGRQGPLMFAWEWTESARRTAEEFYSMPHRKRDLRSIAKERFEMNDVTREYLTLCFSSWRRQLADQPQFRDFVESTIAVITSDTSEFDWHVADDGTLMIQSKQVEDEAARQESTQRQERATAVIFPIAMRRLLDSKKVLSDDGLCSLWNEVQRLAGPDAYADANGQPKIRFGMRVLRVFRRIWDRIRTLFSRPTALHIADAASITLETDRLDSVIAGIALLVKHKEWCSKWPERSLWCQRYLYAAICRAPVGENFDSEASGLASWDEFAADAAAQLWLDHYNDTMIRDMVLRLTLSKKYSVVKRVVQQSAGIRVMYRDEFRGLLRVAMEMAHMRIIAIMVEQVARHSTKYDTSDFVKEADQWINELCDSFVSGTIPKELIPWEVVDPRSRYRSFVRWREILQQRRPGIDTNLVLASHSWLPLLDDAIDQDEREYIAQFWLAAIGAIAEARLGDGRQSAVPSDSEGWILRGVAATIIRLPLESVREYYRPLLLLEKRRAYFCMMFLRDVYEVALNTDIDVLAFIGLLTSIFDDVLTPEGKSRVAWSTFDDAWLALVGLQEIGRRFWKEQHVPLLRKMIGLFVRWIRRSEIYSRHLATLMAWLSLPLCQDLRCHLLPSLAEAVVDGTTNVLDEDDAVHSAAELLRVMLRDNEHELTGHVDTAFRRMLLALTNIQNPLALSLYARLRRLN